MTIINGHVLSKEEEQERKELLSNWQNKPGTVYTVTASGVLAPVPTDADERRNFLENNLQVDGAETYFGGHYDAVNDG